MWRSGDTWRNGDGVRLVDVRIGKTRGGVSTSTAVQSGLKDGLGR